MPYHHREAGQDITPVRPPVSAGFMSDTTATPEQLAGRTELYWLFALVAASLLLVEALLTVREYRRNRFFRSDIVLGGVGRR